MSVLLPKQVDVSKLKYSEVKTLSSGAKTVYINYGFDKLTMQTPVMSLPYGLGEPYENKDTSKGSSQVEKEKKYDLTLSFRGIDENPKIKSFHDKLKDIENKVIDDAFTNRLAWFKDDYEGNKSFVAKLFTPIVKTDKDKETGKIVGKYPSTFKAKLPYDVKNDRFNFDSYNMDNEELTFTDIMYKLKGAKTQLIVQLMGIWFAGGKYGCSWKIVSGKFQLQQSSKITFIEDSDTEKLSIKDDEEEDDDMSVDRDAVAKTTEVPEEEEEEEEVKEEVKEPEPVKKPTKKGGKVKMSV